jgi:hypothetical protein
MKTLTLSMPQDVISKNRKGRDQTQIESRFIATLVVRRGQLLRAIHITEWRLALSIDIGAGAHLIPQSRQLSPTSINKPVTDLSKQLASHFPFNSLNINIPD